MGQLQRGRWICLHKEPHGEDKGERVQVALGEVSSQHKKGFFFTVRTSIHWNNLPRLQFFRNRLLQHGFPMGSQVLPENLLQCGLLSMDLRSCQEPAPVRAPLHGPQVLSGACSSAGSLQGHSFLQGTSTCSGVGSSMGCRRISSPPLTFMGCRVWHSDCEIWRIHGILRSMVEQISILQPVEDPTPEQVDVPRRKLQPMESPCWSRLPAGAEAHGEELTLEQVFWQDL
ncbi:hypothetical protein QYF61_006783 [Mycteria americana]|uniref:Uncharacterized protein n=1 Tax=Mycteria americana TaxID=33587 RepID=A0AAN7MXR5_MYCAM|nr:hypothetical protein QYF61_006783 [Mycteria americana]